MKAIKQKQNKHIKQGSDRAFNIALTIIVTLVLLVVLYPLIYVVSSSLSSGRAVSTGKVFLWPVEFSLAGYKIVFSTSSIWTGYANTILYTAVCTLMNMITTILAAYPLSRRSYQGKKVLDIFFLVTMFFSGGMIPHYILMSNMGLVNSRWGFIVMTGGISVYNMILMRTFFQSSIPNELLEAAKMDGITDFGYLMKVVIPLSKAIFGVIFLYYMVSHWNSYTTPLIYLNEARFQPLQIVMRKIISSSQLDATTVDEAVGGILYAANVDVMKYALIIVSAVPMLVIYPFLQKFFQKGVMVGALKG
jgi:multiple sugar transport system permease protein/putative aldouronate transport system permease protein